MKKRLHPVLAANAVLADWRFVIGINVAFFGVLRFHIVSLDAIDFGMSWVTMAMDQTIIASGWLTYLAFRRWQQKVDKDLHAIKKAVGAHP